SSFLSSALFETTITSPPSAHSVLCPSASANQGLSLPAGRIRVIYSYYTAKRPNRQLKLLRPLPLILPCPDRTRTPSCRCSSREQFSPQPEPWPSGSRPGKYSGPCPHPLPPRLLHDRPCAARPGQAFFCLQRSLSA